MRTGMTAIQTLAMAMLFVVGSSPTGQADLVYESHNGASLIDDAIKNVTRLQNGNLRGQADLNLASTPIWPANLATAGLSWMLPTSAEFTSLYIELDPIGLPGMATENHGSKVILDAGTDDHASSVEMIYGTSLTGTEFDFTEGDSNSSTGVPLYVWTGGPDAPLIPEPSSIVLVVSGLAGPGFFWRVRSMLGRVPWSIG